jgi:hypothetical protein
MHVYTAGGGKEYILYRYVHTADGGNWYTLLVHTASGGKWNTLHVHTAGVGGGERDTHCTSKLQVVENGTCTLHIFRPLLKVLFLLYDSEKSELNAGKKLARHRHFHR